MEAKSASRPARRGLPLLLILVLGIPGVAAAATRHVIPSGGATVGPCTSWGTACTLLTALGVAASGEVWVAAGVYLPTTDVVVGPSTTDRQEAFLVPPGVAVYGGFAGTETQLSARDPRANVTILSGDIDGDDTDTDGNSIAETTADVQGANTYHVLTMDGTGTPITATTVLDGFTITGGQAGGADFPDWAGGGLYCHGPGAASGCSPKLAHLAFRGNSASSGGAIYDNGGSFGVSSPSLTNVTFSGNSAVIGGAIFNVGGGTAVNSPSLVNVILWGDTADMGPEIFNAAATPSIDHSILSACPTGATCTNLVTTDPLLGPLENNGGSTETMALGAGSSALDTGDDGACPATDQRGFARPQDGDADGVAHCDVGAYELVPSMLAVPALGPWGLALLALLLAAGGSLLLRRGELTVISRPA